MPMGIHVSGRFQGLRGRDIRVSFSIIHISGQFDGCFEPQECEWQALLRPVPSEGLAVAYSRDLYSWIMLALSASVV